MNCKAQYHKGESERSQFIRAAEDAAELTIPYLYPLNRSSQGNDYQDFDNPYQSIGSKGVNHLAASLLEQLFPTSRPFFRLTIPELDIPAEQRVEVDQQLSVIERTVRGEFDRRAIRSQIYNAMRLLLVGGTVVLNGLDGNTRVHKLDNVVLRRKPNKTWEYAIIKEVVGRSKVEEIAPGIASQYPERKDFNLYTKQMWEADGSVVVIQSIEEEEVKTDKLEVPVIIPIVTNILDHENYGRSYLSEVIGDLRTLEELSKAVAQSAALASRHIICVDPQGQTGEDDVAFANNGDVIVGRGADVQFVQTSKGADLNIAFQHIQDLKQRLGAAFLLSTATFPERELTATETRARIQEMEAGLGGIYSMLSQTLQLPFLNLLISDLEEKGNIPKLPPEITPSIVTGVDLLDRRTEVSQTMEFIQVAAGLGEQALGMLNIPSVLKAIASNLGLDPKEVIVEQQQGIDPMMAQQMMAQMQDPSVMGGAPGQ